MDAPKRRPKKTEVVENDTVKTPKRRGRLKKTVVENDTIKTPKRRGRPKKIVVENITSIEELKECSITNSDIFQDPTTDNINELSNTTEYNNHRTKGKEQFSSEFKENINSENDKPISNIRKKKLPENLKNFKIKNKDDNNNNNALSKIRTSDLENYAEDSLKTLFIIKDSKTNKEDAPKEVPTNQKAQHNPDPTEKSELLQKGTENKKSNTIVSKKVSIKKDKSVNRNLFLQNIQNSVEDSSESKSPEISTDEKSSDTVHLNKTPDNICNNANINKKTDEPKREDSETKPKKKSAKRVKASVINTDVTQRQLRSSGKLKIPPIFYQDRNIYSDNYDWYFINEDKYLKKLEIILDDFKIPDENQREGNKKLFYTYILFEWRDDEKLKNITLKDFINKIFYPGKGTNKRCYDHNNNAQSVRLGTVSPKKKFNKTLTKTILDIQNNGDLVGIVKVAKDIVAIEALTREGLIIDAIGLKRLNVKSKLCNNKGGEYYGIAKTLSAIEKFEMGFTLLVQTWKSLIEEGCEFAYPDKTIKSSNEIENADSTKSIDAVENIDSTKSIKGVENIELLRSISEKFTSQLESYINPIITV